MLQKTYDKIRNLFQGGTGYLRTTELLSAGITTLQLRQLLDDGSLEHVTHGIYWWKADHRPKPKNYKYLELQMANPNSVICMESALYLLGFLKKEPSEIRVATSRTDRSRMHMNFPIRRHYFAERSIREYVQQVETPAGPVSVYSIDRSVVDCIRLRNSIDPELFQRILTAYKKKKDKNPDVFYAYANDMGLQRVAAECLSR